ncbi:hypothetical protein niasHT_028516 [Heterodera trifolii]|uniref:PPPDE domain-containing protein n=1 Tax=Heterodera trifolii TaxID=157864 RepID=A0ABD2KPV3_9BILA
MKILAHQMLVWEPYKKLDTTPSKYGLYRSHKGMIRQMDVSIGYMAIQDIFKQMPDTGHYNLATFNCQHWSNAFFEKENSKDTRGFLVTDREIGIHF